MPTYDIAISFPGEDRPIAEQLAGNLLTEGVNVFYGEYAQAELWGKDVYAHLQKISRTEAKFCLMLVTSGSTISCGMHAAVGSNASLSAAD